MSSLYSRLRKTPRKPTENRNQHTRNGVSFPEFFRLERNLRLGMTQANRVDPRAKQLKDHFASINAAPRLAKDSPLAEKTNLERIAPAVHLSAQQLATTPDEQIRQVGKALTLALFIPEYAKERRETSFLQGLILFWYSFLEPMAPVHPAPPIARVITYCAELSHHRAFLRGAQRWVQGAFADDPAELRNVIALLTPEHFRKIVLVGLPTSPTESERRTFGNYLNHVARELEVRLESLVPELFVEGASALRDEKIEEKRGDMVIVPPASVQAPIRVQPPEPLMWVAGEMINVGFRLPGLSKSPLRADGYVECPIAFRGLLGYPRVPAFIAGADADLKGMAGFLSGVLGSGRTAFLKYLTYQYSRQFILKKEGALAYYFRAEDFVIHARNRRSIHDFVAEGLLALGGKTEGLAELPEMLHRMDQAGKLLLLVDDLDRLSDADQSEVLSQLTFSPAVIFAVLPWQVERLATLTPRLHLGLFKLPLLTVQEQWAILERMSHATEIGYDPQRAEQLLSELPDLAQVPLGVITIFDQAQQPWTDATQVVEVALEEYLRRAGLPPLPFGHKPPEFTREWFHLKSASHNLLSLLRQPDGYEELGGETNVTVSRFMVENPNGYAWSMKWEEVARTGLFRPVPHPAGEGLGLINQDLTCYLLAQAGQEALWQTELPPRSIHPNAADLLERAARHQRNLNNPERVRHILGLPPPMTIAEPQVKERESKSWLARVPEIFRNLS